MRNFRGGGECEIFGGGVEIYLEEVETFSGGVEIFLGVVGIISGGVDIFWKWLRLFERG